MILNNVNYVQSLIRLLAKHLLKFLQLKIRMRSFNVI